MSLRPQAARDECRGNAGSARERQDGTDDGGIPVQIRRVEDLGRRRLARVALGPHEIFATVPPDMPIDGEQAGLTIRQDRLFVYANDELVAGNRP